MVYRFFGNFEFHWGEGDWFDGDAWNREFITGRELFHKFLKFLNGVRLQIKFPYLSLFIRMTTILIFSTFQDHISRFNYINKYTKKEYVR